VRLQHLAIPALLTAALGACGGDEKKDEKKDEPSGPCELGDIGCGSIVASKDDKISISLEKSASGDKYVVMPYSVGKVATVDGAGTEKNIFTVPVGKQALRSPDKKAFGAWPESQSTQINDVRRTRSYAGKLAHLIYGRWNPKFGRDGQAPGFWNLVRAYDQVQADLAAENGLNALGQKQTLEEQFLQEINHSDRLIEKDQSAALLASTCPAVDDDLLLPGGDNTEVKEVVAGADYCIVYQDEPKAETDKTAIEATVKATLATYKKVIYGDEFASAENGFTFKPVFVIIDPANSDYGMPEAFLGFLGVFTAKETDETKMPMLYLASDLSKIQGLANDAKGKASFHATITHELQHAISFYYRAMKAKTESARNLETVFLDEGLAHTMEDVFGYGSEEFADYAGNFLQGFPNGLYPFFAGSKLPEDMYTGDNAEQFNTYRGGAQAFLYYLASQKGGIEFTDGKVSGGDGLKFYAALTTSGKVGATNLQDSFAHASWTWTETVGHFLCALILDNSSVPKVEKMHQTAEPFKEATDLQETKNKTFGMRFNNFGAIKDSTAEGASNPYVPYENATLEVLHYHTLPGLITVSDSKKPVEIATPDDEGTAAAVVRIK
jgi:hypothetical protein